MKIIKHQYWPDGVFPKNGMEVDEFFADLVEITDEKIAKYNLIVEELNLDPNIDYTLNIEGVYNDICSPGMWKVIFDEGKLDPTFNMMIRKSDDITISVVDNIITLIIGEHE